MWKTGAGAGLIMSSGLLTDYPERENRRREFQVLAHGPVAVMSYNAKNENPVMKERSKEEGKNFRGGVIGR